MPRQPRKVDPRRTYVVADGHTPLTPAFLPPGTRQSLSEGTLQRPTTTR
jgi:hypothetical protein